MYINSRIRSFNICHDDPPSLTASMAASPISFTFFLASLPFSPSINSLIGFSKPSHLTNPLTDPSRVSTFIPILITSTTILAFSGGKWNKKGHGWEFISTLNTYGNSFDILRKWDVDYIDVGVGKGVGEKRMACRSGEDGDGNSIAEKETSKVEDRDNMAFGHERKQNNMRRSH
ncbi:hypothetical protein RDI58_004648 [Solanum bulbocastanum]|uniref:Uncharacterized protein n=1 Tax=Solanum bulbocastanum TaxID=147425 RepID=A0AAN8YLT3_SOLBU